MYEGNQVYVIIKALKNKTIAVGWFVLKVGLFILDCSVNTMSYDNNMCLAAQEVAYSQYTEFMHKRMLYISAGKMNILHNAVEGIKLLNIKPHQCTTCAAAKQTTKALSKKAVPRASKPLEKVYIDLLGGLPESVNK